MDETLKIIIGYISFFAFMGLVMFVGELAIKKTNVNKEVCRKLEHIATGFSWLICCFTTGITIHTVIINFVGLVILALVTFTDLMKSVQRDNADKSYGLFYFGLSTFIAISVTVFINKDFYWFTGIAYYCMVLGDGIAPLVAKSLKKNNPKIIGDKTLFGSLTVFVFSAFSCWIFSYVCNLNFSLLFILSLASLVAVIELFSVNCTDNLTIDLLAFGYLVLNYYYPIPEVAQVTILVAFPMVLLNGATKALTDNANVVSYLYTVISAICVGFSMMISILALYVVAGIVGVFTLRIFNKKTGNDKKLSRKTKQILANSLIAMAMCIVYKLSGNQLFLFASFCVIVEEFADSMASDIGRISRRNAIDILSFKKVISGISGGITVLGSISALVACGLGLLVPYAFNVFPLTKYLILVGIAFVGVFIDSILGSLLQVLYKCPVCDNPTEQKTHCLVQTDHVKGVAWIDNSMVNFLSGLMTAMIVISVMALI